MVILLHVLLALSSITYTTYLLFSPAKGKFRTAYILVASTIASGFGLVVITHSPILQTCVSGLAFLAVNGAGLALAHYRLAGQKLDNRD